MRTSLKRRRGVVRQPEPAPVLRSVRLFQRLAQRLMCEAAERGRAERAGAEERLRRLWDATPPAPEPVTDEQWGAEENARREARRQAGWEE